MEHRFQRRYRLTKTDEFSSVFGFRRSYHAAYLQLLYVPNEKGLPRVGIVVSKRIAKRAVDRNYMKRVCREYFRCHKTSFGQFDVVLRIKKKFVPGMAHTVHTELAQLTKRLPMV